MRSFRSWWWHTLAKNEGIGSVHLNKNVTCRLVAAQLLVQGPLILFIVWLWPITLMLTPLKLAFFLGVHLIFAGLFWYMSRGPIPNVPND